MKTKSNVKFGNHIYFHAIVGLLNKTLIMKHSKRYQVKWNKRKWGWKGKPGTGDLSSKYTIDH